MHTHLARPRLEDQPAPAGVDVRELDDVPEERTSGLGVLGHDHGVDGGDHRPLVRRGARRRNRGFEGHPGRTSPDRIAKTTSCAGSRAPSLTIARLTWVRTVSGLTTSSPAISAFDIPVATHDTISRSRSVRSASRGCGSVAGALAP